MRKIIVSLCLILFLVFVTSCTVEEHECEFKDSYEYNDTKHWQKCSVKGCREKNNEDEHYYSIVDSTLVDEIYTITKKCIVCNYQITDQFNYDSVIDTNEEWNILFETFMLTNYTMNVYIDNEDEPIYNSCYVSEDGIKVIRESILDTYSIRQADGTFKTYEYYQYDGKWHLQNDTSDRTYMNFIEESRLYFSFKDTFNKFIYDESKGLYKCEEELIAIIYPNDEVKIEEIKLFNTEIVIIDGKIFSIKANYQLDSDDAPVNNFEYFNIGTTVVTIPDEVVNNAKNKQ